MRTTALNLKSVATKAMTVLLICCVASSALLFPVKVLAIDAYITGGTLDGIKSEITVSDPGSLPKLLSTAESASGILGGIDTLKDLATNLNPLGWALAKLVIRGIVQSTIQWINNGFEGNPLFISNPQAFFQVVGEQALGAAIEKYIPELCSPFQISIRRQIYLQRRPFQEQIRCTLSDVIDNIEGFIDGAGNDYGQLGGWKAWDVMTSNPQNNPYGASILAGSGVSIAVQAGQQTYERELTLGEGFLSWRDPECVKNLEARRKATGGSGIEVDYGVGLDFIKISGGCRINTPGSVIANQLNHTLGLGTDSLVEADEINEIVGAILEQLTLKLLGQEGLAGLGRDAAYAPDTFSGQLAAEDRKDFENIRDSAVTRLQAEQDLERSFASAKSGAGNRVDASIILALSVQKCFENKLATSSSISLSDAEKTSLRNQATAASSTVSNLNLLKAEVEAQTAIAGVNERNLGLIIQKLLALVYPDDRGNLSTVIHEEDRIRSDLHNSADLTEAQRDRDGGMADRLKTTDEESNTRLTQCQNFVPGGTFNFGNIIGL